MFKEIADTCYVPLLKLLKSCKHLRISLNTPLSLLEQMEKCGYKSWIDDMKLLIDKGQVEIVGSAAYHTLLTKVPPAIAEKQIILNEYALGYYYGRRTGFEGEKAILVKDLLGFFPPELAINSDLVSLVSNLGYEWILADESSFVDTPDVVGGSIVKFKNIKTALVVRSRELSNTLAFKRDSDISTLKDSLSSSNIVLALDGETFGHHNKDGISLLYNIYDQMLNMNNEFQKVTEYVNNYSAKVSSSLETVQESTWGTSDSDMIKGDIYPLWRVEGNKVNTLHWQLFNVVINSTSFDNKVVLHDEYSNVPLWDPKTIYSAEDMLLKDKVTLDILFMKCLSSDQFWWSSNKTLNNGIHLYDKDMLLSSLSLYSSYASLLKDPKLSSEINNLISDIKFELNK